MIRSELKLPLLGFAAVSVIAFGAYILSALNGANQKAPKTRIVLDLSRPDEIRSHVTEWIPFLPGEIDELIGAIEGKPVEIVLKQGSKEYSFESALITVNIDVTKEGSVKRIFISSTGMTLHESVSGMKQILAMVDAKPDRLKKWTNGALAWSKDPKSWPRETLSPMDAWYSEILRTPENEYELEVRSSGDNAKPWRIIVRTGPRMFNVVRPANEAPGEGPPRTTEE